MVPQYQKRWQDRNREYVKAWRRNYMRKRYIENKQKVINHYSNNTGQCNHCGISDARVLSIDHIKGNGLKHLKSINKSSGSTFYEWLVKNNFPSGYQILCMNCQAIKRITNGETTRII